MQAFEVLTYRGQIGRLRGLGEQALREWGITKARLTPLRHEANTTFRVHTATGDRYTLRIHRPGVHSTDAIRSEMLWLNALQHDTDLRVPEPIATTSGDFLTTSTIEGVPEPRECVLFRWMDGRFFEDQLSPQHLERVGRFTAHLHDHAAHWHIPAGFTRSRVDNITAEARRIELNDQDAAARNFGAQPSEADATRILQIVEELCTADDMALVARAIAQIRAMMRDLDDGPDVFGLIHADLHHENYFFHRGAVCAIDFDDCGWGHYLYDLSVTLIEIQHLPQYNDVRAALLCGYRSMRPLPELHETYLPTFWALRRLQLLLWVLQSRDHPAFRDEWKEWSRELLDRLNPLDAAHYSQQR